MRACSMAVLVISLTGCGDPIAGRWRATDPDNPACPALRTSFELDGDMAGGGVRPAQTPSGCFECQISLSGESPRDERYELVVTLESCAFGDGGKTERLDCRLRSESDRLACDKCRGDDTTSCVDIDFERDD